MLRMDDTVRDEPCSEVLAAGMDAEDEAGHALGEALLRLRDDSDPGRVARELQDVRARLFGGAPPERRIGRYRLGERLGAGGMGEVFAGHDESLDRPVAIKLLHPDHPDHGDESRARMVREAQTLAKLSHPNVVQVYEVGEAEGRLFIAMELIRGRSLRAWVKHERPGWREVVARYMDAARGLAAVHRAGLVHRDFKPDNVLLGDDGRVCVADFGLARHASMVPSPIFEQSVTGEPTSRSGSSATVGSGAGGARLTRTGRIAGTPAYMAPEQLRGAEVDAKADQFALCVSLYEALYGRRPFVGRSLSALAESHRAGAMGPPRRSPVPRRVWRVLERGLATEPHERFETVEALVRALDPARARRRRVLLGSVAAVALASTVASRAVLGDPCPSTAPAGAPGAIEATWDQEHRSALHERVATEQGFAVTSLGEIEGRLDAWGEAWHASRRTVCRATRVEGVQSEAALDLRMACLDRKRRDFGVVVDALLDPESSVASRAPELLQGLPSLVACGSARHLGEVEPLPEDPQQRERILAAFDELARVRALAAAGRFEEAEARRVELEARAEHLAHVPLTLEVQSLLGRLELLRGRPVAAVEPLIGVAREAEARRLDELAASLRVEAAEAAAGRWSQPEREHGLVADADAALRRLGHDDDPRELSMLEAQAALLEDAGDFEGALAGHRRARDRAEALGESARAEAMSRSIAAQLRHLHRHDEALQELEAGLRAARQRWGDGSPTVGMFEFDLSLVRRERGELEAARRHLDRAESIYVGALGPDSLLAARARFARADLVRAMGDDEAALALLEEVLPSYERALGPGHELMAEAHEERGVLQFYQGELAGSIDSYRAALAIRERVHGPTHPAVALLHSNIGESQLALGEVGAAVSSFELALALYRTGASADSPDLALPLKGRGQARLALGRVAEAIDDLERALEIHVAADNDPWELADVRFALARAIVQSGGPSERAATLARQAREGFTSLDDRERAEAVDAWLARHGG